MNEKLLPYFDERQSPVDMLILHCNAFDLDTFLYWMNEYKCSAHYYIDFDGTITRLVPEEKRAFHAGPGYWRGSDFSPNSRSVGIELRQETLGQTPYSPAQIKSLVKLSKEIVKRYKIIPQNIIGHSDIGIDRKADPGPCFPWKKLTENGLGRWPDLRKRLNCENIGEMLALIGYDTRTEDKIKFSAYAFCRHFLPQYVKIDKDIQHLVDNTGTDNYDFMNEADFIRTLQAAALAYSLK